MCTAITFKGKDNYFGRTLDVEMDYKTSVVITPRNYFTDELKNKYAIIGMAIPYKDFPLYFDAMNECGLCIAGLNFPGNAKYFSPQKDKLNVPLYKFICYISGRCSSSDEAKKLLENMIITGELYENMPTSPLHFIISDKDKSITVEQTGSGLHVYDNPVGVLANNPEFNWHITNLVNYMNITTDEATNRMLKGIDLKPFCKGLGGAGLPGDLSSPSRFIRATFAKNRALVYNSEEQNVSQFFHIAGFVEQTTGLAKANDSYEQTLYTSCMNLERGIYYYTTYFNSKITGITMMDKDINGKKLIIYPIKYGTEIEYL